MKPDTLSRAAELLRSASALALMDAETDMHQQEGAPCACYYHSLSARALAMALTLDGAAIVGPVVEQLERVPDLEP